MIFQHQTAPTTSEVTSRPELSWPVTSLPTWHCEFVNKPGDFPSPPVCLQFVMFNTQLLGKIKMMTCIHVTCCSWLCLINVKAMISIPISLENKSIQKYSMLVLLLSCCSSQSVLRRKWSEVKILQCRVWPLNNWISSPPTCYAGQQQKCKNTDYCKKYWAISFRYQLYFWWYFSD